MLGTISSFAQADQQKLRDAETALLSLIDTIRQAPPGSPYPRYSDPEIAFLFGKAFDSTLVTGGEPMVAELEALARLQDLSMTLARAYLTANLPDGQTDSLNDPETRAQVGSNFVRFLPELALAYDYSIALGGRLARIGITIASNRSDDPNADAVVASALDVLAAQQASRLEVVLGCAADQAIENAWRRERLSILNRFAPDFAGLFAKRRAQGIADRALAAAISEDDPELADQFKIFALSLLR